MTPRARSILRVFAVSGIVLGGLVAALVVPRWPAIQCLLGFQAPVGADLEDYENPPADLELLTDTATHGAERIWLLPQSHRRPPAILFVHGVAPKGIRDGRILQAARAFHAAGFTVVVPELPTLVDPLAPQEPGGAIPRVLAAMAAGRMPNVHPERIGVVGISVGGALALRGVARFRAGGGKGVRALLLIGAPDDLRTAAVDWFEAADPAPKSDGSLAWERRHAAAFARSFLLRAGLPLRLGPDPDLRALDAWMATDPLPSEPLEGVTSQAALEVATLLRAAPTVRAAARERVLADAGSRITGLSPVLWNEELAAIRGIAVFLLHGHGDPLVPITQAGPLAARLRAHTVVSVLESHMVGHTSVNDASLGERLAHVVQMDDFFTMTGR